MGHREVSLAALVVLSFITMSALGSVYPYPRHVNPLEVPIRVSPAEILRFYRQVSLSFAKLDFNNASYLLEYSRRIHVPENLRSALDRIDSLYSDLMNRINETKTALSSAKKAFYEDDLESAELLCALAKGRLTEAEATYHLLTESLRSFTAFAGLPQTYTEEIAAEAAMALEALEKDLSATMELVESAKEEALVGTDLSLYVSETKVECFGKLSFWGALSDSQGKPLPNRVIYVTAGNSSYTLRTDQAGVFRGDLQIREYAGRSIKLQARFVPTDLDRGLYRASKSGSVELQLQCLVPELRVWVKPPTTYPGSTVVLEVTSTIPGIGLEVYDPFTKEKTNIVVPQSLRYLMELRVPATAEPGRYPVEVKSLPRAGLAPTQTLAQVVVLRKTPEVKVSYSAFALSGLSARVCVTTNTRSTVVLTYRYANVSKEVIDSDCLDVPVPAYYLESNLRLTLAVIPGDPSYERLAIPIEVKAYSIPLLALIPASIALLLRGAHRPRRYERKTHITEEPSKRSRADEGEGGAEVVYRVLELVAEVSGATIRSWQTFREFLQEVAEKLPRDVLGVVRRIFEAIELLLYGPPHRYSEALGDVRQLIKKLIERGSGGDPEDG